MENFEKTIVKKKISGLQLWSIKDNEEENKGNDTAKKILTSFAKKCHQLLYSTSSIVGTKAQNDIMKIFSVKILGKLEDLKEDSENIQNEWRKLMSKELIKNYPNIFFEEDKVFNCKDDGTINKIIKEAKGFELNEETRDSFSTTYGDIYEYFMSGYGKKSSSGSKELGQFFTPRKLIHLIFHGFNLKDYITDKQNFKIYDPCMGTGGFLTRLYKLGDLKPENIFGCETEIDTIKFGVLGTFLSTGKIPTGLIKCNSLSENPLISKEKFDGIVTNPPFGTDMNYQELKKTYNSKFPETKISFQEVYPINTNNGTCLFVQHCIYILKDKGFCAIVLPYGELFNGTSKWSKSFRKWFSETVNIKIILKVPSGTFDHASVKTNVVFFTKDGPTQNIRFMETGKGCEHIKEMFTISASELKITGYSLDTGEYIEEQLENYDVPMIRLGEICEFIRGKKINSKDGKKEGKYPLYYCSILGNLWCDDYDYEGKALIINTTNGSGKSMIYFANGKYSIGQSVFHFKISSNDRAKIEYIYLFLKINRYILEKEYKGTLQKSITKERLDNIIIPLPSLEKQQQIIDELSKIETSIKTIELRISQLKCEQEQYKKYGSKADIHRLLKDSEEKMMGEVCEFKSYKYLKRSDMIEGKYKVIGGGKKPSGYHNNYNKDKDTILCSGTGSYAGYISKYKEPVWASESFSIHSQDKTLLNEIYLYLYLVNIQEYLYSKRPESGGQPHMYPKTLSEKIKIPVPSQEIQKQCIEIFEEKEKFIQSIDEKIKTEQNYIEEMKQLAKDVISSYC